MRKRIIPFIAATVSVGMGFLAYFLLTSTQPRTLETAPKYSAVDSHSAELEAGFELETGGDQGCFFHCVEVGLRVWARKGNVEAKQLFRSCKEAGFGDPFIDGADCDGERLLLKTTGSVVHVLSREKAVLSLDLSRAN
jgi:hypothetical protein